MDPMALVFSLPCIMAVLSVTHIMLTGADERAWCIEPWEHRCATPCLFLV